VGIQRGTFVAQPTKRYRKVLQDGVLKAIRYRSRRSSEKISRAIRHLFFIYRRGPEYRLVVRLGRDARR
jgi:hypothetical protein